MVGHSAIVGDETNLDGARLSNVGLCTLVLEVNQVADFVFRVSSRRDDRTRRSSVLASVERGGKSGCDGKKSEGEDGGETHVAWRGVDWLI